MNSYSENERHWVRRNYWRQNFVTRFIVLGLLAVCMAPTTAANYSLVGSWACTFSPSAAVGMLIPASFVFKANGSETWHMDALPTVDGIGTYAYESGILRERMRRGFGEPSHWFEPRAWLSDSMRPIWESANHFWMRAPNGRAASSFDVVNGIYDCKRH
uniref:Uncharacterized protein n=1 Tax=mine drainage metagenome TaxID=410659 RepID=E6Q0Q7_9ZZZZ